MALLRNFTGTKSPVMFAGPVVAGTNAGQTVTVTGTPTGGTFKLAFRGRRTATINHNANAATVQGILEDLSTIGEGNVTATGTLSGGMLITFGGVLGKLSLPLLTLAENNLTGGTTPTATITNTTPGVTATARGMEAGRMAFDSETGLGYINSGTEYAPNLSPQGAWLFYDLTAATATTGGAALSVANPFGVDLLVTRAIVRTTTPSGGASALDLGLAADGETTSDILIDGLALGSAAKVADNINDAGTNGKARQIWTAEQFLTGTVSATAAGVVGKVLVHVIPLE